MEQRLVKRLELAILVPEWSLECRRLTPSNGYLETLSADICDLLVGPIDEVTETGIRMKDGHTSRIQCSCVRDWIRRFPQATLDESRPERTGSWC